MAISIIVVLMNFVLNCTIVNISFCTNIHNLSYVSWAIVFFTIIIAIWLKYTRYDINITQSINLRCPMITLFLLVLGFILYSVFNNYCTVNSIFFFLRVQMKNSRLRSVILYVSSYNYVYKGFLACIHFRNVRNRLQMHSDHLTFFRRTLGTSSEVSVWKMLNLSNLAEHSK